MRDKELYARILGIEAPWHVREVDLELQAGEDAVQLFPDGIVGQIAAGSRRWWQFPGFVPGHYQIPFYEFK